MVLEKIVVGRDKKDLTKFGEKGTAYIGKHIVGEGEEAHLTNPICMDVIRPHVVLVCGKRGEGKSYTVGVIAEEITRLPKEIKQNLSVLFIDTMGIYWSMKNPNEKDADLLKEWGLKPQGLNIRFLAPKGFIEEYEKVGVKVDKPLTISYSDLTAQDWTITFNFSLNEPEGIAIERALKAVKKRLGSDYIIDDIVKEIEGDKKSEKTVKNKVINRFLAAEDWGILERKGTPVKSLFSPGTVSILDVSHFVGTGRGWSVRGMLIGLFARKIYQERLTARKSEEFEVMGGEGGKTIPMVWIMIDECLPYDSKVVTDKAHTSIGEIVEKFKNGEKFKVLGYDYLKGEYDYFDVTDVFRRPKRELIEITTETERKIKCTPDHKILTRNGFLSAEKAEEIATPVAYHYSKNKKLVRARIIGHIFGDGWLSPKAKIVGFSGKGNVKDLEKIKDDLALLGFSSGSIHSRKTKSEITHASGKKVKVSGTSQELHASWKAFRYFSKFCPILGDKTLTKSYIPKWLSNASKEEKAEFLAALMGSDATAPSPDKYFRVSFNPIRLSFNKSEQLEKNAFEFANQIKKMFGELGVKVSNIRKREGNIRKNGTKTIKIEITLAKSVNNTISFLEKVGYRYCERKEIESNKWIAYLKSRLAVVKKRMTLRKKMKKMHNAGLSLYEISKRLQIPYYQIKWWTKHEDKPSVTHDFPDFKEWVKGRYSKDLIYEKITRIKKVAPDYVYDITVDKVHNFVANGCIVHNCHMFLPSEGSTVASEPLLTLVKQGREPGISLLFITQMPNKLHPDALAQSDLVISHRLTAEADLKALRAIMQSYMMKDISEYINALPKQKGSAIVLDDNSERIYTVQIRPRLSWHAGGSPAAIKEKGLFD